MLKRFATLAATAALALGMASAAMAQDAPRIVVVVHGQAADPFWSVVKNGVDAAQKDTGATVEYRSPASTAGRTSTMRRTMPDCSASTALATAR